MFFSCVCVCDTVPLFNIINKSGPQKCLLGNVFQFSWWTPSRHFCFCSDWFHLLLCWSYLTKLEYTFYTKIWLISGKPELHILQLLTLSRFFLPTPELIYSKLSRPWKSIPEIIWHILSRPPEFVTLHACTSIFICHIFGNNNYCTSWKYETI